MSAELPRAMANALYQHGYLPTDSQFVASPLAGGVSSDIWRVETQKGALCIKMALPQLKVTQQWFVPVERNEYEVAWLQQVKKVAPNAVPNVVFHDVSQGVFAMDFLTPEQYPNWKQQLLKGRVSKEFAAQLGNVVGLIHRNTAGNQFCAEKFATDDIFYALRPSPYFLATAVQHPKLEKKMIALCDLLMRNKKALVHGDMSPKNILMGPAGPVILDAETAWYGDPAFDVAFCVNHLSLKALHMPDCREELAVSINNFIHEYRNHLQWEDEEALFERVARFLPALLLARIDGKSPLEYICDVQVKERVRSFAVPRLLQPKLDLPQLLNEWFQHIQ